MNFFFLISNDRSLQIFEIFVLPLFHEMSAFLSCMIVNLLKFLLSLCRSQRQMLLSQTPFTVQAKSDMKCCYFSNLINVTLQDAKWKKRNSPKALSFIKFCPDLHCRSRIKMCQLGKFNKVRQVYYTG